MTGHLIEDVAERHTTTVIHAVVLRKAVGVASEMIVTVATDIPRQMYGATLEMSVIDLKDQISSDPSWSSAQRCP